MSPVPRPESIDLARLASELAIVAKSYPSIAAVWIFGSAVRGALRFDSDVDVGVLFTAGARDREIVLAGFAARLEAFTAPFPVDAVDLAEQGVMFGHEVLCTGRLLYEADRERRIDFEWKTAARASDFRPTYELAVRGQREGLLRRLGTPR